MIIFRAGSLGKSLEIFSKKSHCAENQSFSPLPIFIHGTELNLNILSRTIPYLNTLPNNVCTISIQWAELYPISLHWADLYPILIHWPELYPILTHWDELYPILKYWHELYPILIHWPELFFILIQWAELHPILIHESNDTLS